MFAAGGVEASAVPRPQGKFISFDPGFSTQPTSINDEGAITGSPGFVRSPDGTITLFDPPFCIGAVSITPPSINDEGVITGTCDLGFPGPTGGWLRFP